MSENPKSCYRGGHIWMGTAHAMNHGEKSAPESLGGARAAIFTVLAALKAFLDDVGRFDRITSLSRDSISLAQSMLS